MIAAEQFITSLDRLGIRQFAGVPDSLLKDFCACLAAQLPAKRHQIVANEGAGVALAAGHYLGTGKPALVYLQNSGLGNLVNPLTSLVDSEVYSIPVLLLVGWRGEPGVHDEPQHIKQGKITLALFETLGIPARILPATAAEAEEVLNEAVERMQSNLSPFALVVKKDTFAPFKLAAKPTSPYSQTRESAIGLVLNSLPPSAVVVSTTGMASREVFEFRARTQQGHHRDFLTVGSMGHASQIALGLARARPDREVYCLDGDGAVIMHMGALAILGTQAVPNLKHVVINNGAHDSVGGQPTVGFAIDIPGIARACRYLSADTAATPEETVAKLDLLRAIKGPALLEIRVQPGARKDLGRPTRTPQENKQDLLSYLSVDPQAASNA